MKLVLYSGGQSRSNHKLHQAVVSLAKQGRKKTSRPLQLTYIPFCSDNSSIFFNRAVRRYRSHGVERFQCLNVDDSPSAAEIASALQSDIIYLAGGNTFYFLHYLQKTGLLEKLKAFAKNGGVIAGLSAGGLIMSPTVKIAADESLGPDENDLGVKDFRGMGLFQFEFSPHFENTPRHIKAHLGYSETTPYPIYAAEDGSGMVINGNEILVHGNASFFYRGTQLKLRK